ncbi:hypothetical protein [Microbacterium oleivorans]|uniref:hypothetical protein n=1 Tax=Microbacterium oleivorans TaxID=273677 RepID=UPI000767463E|nr:hypothetical protein [Microbacterium oleivorans]
MRAPRARSRRAVMVLAAVVSTAAFTTGCAPQGGPSTAPGASASPDAPGAPPVASPTIDPEDVTCENMLSSETVDTFTATGWTVREDPFVILDLELPQGTSCTWGDFTSPTNDDLVLFGWSPISDADASATRTALEAEGWLLEDDSRGVLVTEDPASALRVDDEGYGMTYLFREGWVEVSDTKQGLDLIDLG